MRAFSIKQITVPPSGHDSGLSANRMLYAFALHGIYNNGNRDFGFLLAFARRVLQDLRAPYKHRQMGF
jgi:hypothetical protein